MSRIFTIFTIFRIKKTFTRIVTVILLIVLILEILEILLLLEFTSHAAVLSREVFGLRIVYFRTSQAKRDMLFIPSTP